MNRFINMALNVMIYFLTEMVVEAHGKLNVFEAITIFKRLRATKSTESKKNKNVQFESVRLHHIQPLSLCLEMETGLLGNLCPSNLFQSYSAF